MAATATSSKPVAGTGVAAVGASPLAADAAAERALGKVLPPPAMRPPRPRPSRDFAWAMREKVGLERRLLRAGDKQRLPHLDTRGIGDAIRV